MPLGSCSEGEDIDSDVKNNKIPAYWLQKGVVEDDLKSQILKLAVKARVRFPREEWQDIVFQANNHREKTPRRRRMHATKVPNLGFLRESRIGQLRVAQRTWRM